MNDRNCKNWSGEACNLNLHGGRPSAGVCQKLCTQRKSQEPDRPAAPAGRENVWTAMHQRSLRPVTDAVAELAYLRHLPDGQPQSCGCRARWATYLAEHPPTFETPEAYFEWGVAAHNAVNERLGKPTLSVEAAREMHRQAPKQTAAIPLLLLAFPLVHRSAEWEANVKTCRNSGTAGVGVTTKRRCPHYIDGQPEICAKDGHPIVTHTFRGTCPEHRMPHMSMPHPAAKLPATSAPPKVEQFGSNTDRDRARPAPPAESVDFLIDLVYLWVDGSDPQWQTQYKKAMGRSPSAGSRFTSVDELKYSLRSVERFAPWINRIHIVTSGQRPSWLAESERVRVVSHMQIMDPVHLPTFNSQAIECHIHNIPGLAEHFLYANDDMLFGAALSPGHFFRADGMALMRFAGDHVHDKGSGIFSRMKERAATLLDGFFGVRNWQKGYHHIKPYRLSMLKELAGRIPEVITKSAGHRTRCGQDVAWNCGLWPAYSVAAGYAIATPDAQHLKQFYVEAGPASRRQMVAAVQSMPDVICVNNSSPASAALTREFLEAYLPDGSAFERWARWATLAMDGPAIMTGCDASQERFLPFWYARVRRHCQWPIIFADKGMTEKARQWCTARGDLIDARVSVDHAFLRKPFALIQTPYSRTLWMDPDCEVMGDISHVFDGLGSADILVANDIPRFDPAQAGVIAYRHGFAGMIEWVRLAGLGFGSDVHRVRKSGDQAIMCHLIKAGTIIRARMGWEYNHLNGLPEADRPATTLIRHYTGKKWRLEARIKESGEQQSIP